MVRVRLFKLIQSTLSQFGADYDWQTFFLLMTGLEEFSFNLQEPLYMNVLYLENVKPFFPMCFQFIVCIVFNSNQLFCLKEFFHIIFPSPNV